ncbi:DMT family transporter [Flavobacterium sp. NKUCC04_CG]|uniref:DMT family transporter n=1 Tax=Flavobacterium sp. NKUCC04_CG TaxID=2842121 RepID=UPI001C5B944E|nr:EamA family transporter [Flavobacterium sp. NKUCC04_CG]MBW3520149.1 EamA family transporter [Flavobacterium sp. NKUCC04_CG]
MKITLKNWLTLLVLSLVWGSSFILIKKGLNSFTPYQLGSLRVVFAGIMLLPTAFINRKQFPRKNYPWLILCAVVGSFIPMFLFPVAEMHLDSSIAGIMNALMSIFVIVLGAVFFKYKTNYGELTGVTLAFIGVILLLQNSSTEGGTTNHLWFYYTILIIAAMMYAFSGLLTQKYMGNISPLTWTAFIELVLFLPALLTLYLSGFFEVLAHNDNAWEGVGYIFVLSLFGSVLANIFYYKLIGETSASFASSVSLLMPIVAFMWGLLDGENLGLIQISGGVLIIAGLYFGRKNIKIKYPFRKNRKGTLSKR